MSASVKIMLYTHKTYSDGQHPIIIQVIVNRKPVRKVVGRCTKDQWDDDSKRVKTRKHPNYATINRNIIDEFHRIEREILSNETITKSQAKKTLVNKDEDAPEELPMLINMLEHRVKHYYSLLKIGAYSQYSTIVDELKEWVKPNKDIPIVDINVKWVEKYAHHLSTREIKPNKPNTVAKKLAAIKSVIIEASKRDRSISNPFDDFQIKKQKVLKQKLTIEELEMFKNCPVNTVRQQMCRDIFLLQIYLRGMRIGDVLQLKKASLVGDRLRYEDDKTGKSYDLKVIGQAKKIIDHYSAGHEAERVFPLLKWQYNKSESRSENEFKRRKAIESSTAQVNNVIFKIGEKSGIKKPIRTHIARHTYIKMAFDKIQNPRITMGLAGHTSLKIHQGYIEDLINSDELDGAADSIFE